MHNESWFICYRLLHTNQIHIYIIIVTRINPTDYDIIREEIY